jgi:hypothetical protein
MNATCWEPGCGELIEGGSCWCLEHLDTGCTGELDTGADCEHPAHCCQEPIHYCQAHGGAS